MRVTILDPSHTFCQSCPILTSLGCGLHSNFENKWVGLMLVSTKGNPFSPVGYFDCVMLRNATKGRMITGTMPLRWNVSVSPTPVCTKFRGIQLEAVEISERV